MRKIGCGNRQVLDSGFSWAPVCPILGGCQDAKICGCNGLDTVAERRPGGHCRSSQGTSMGILGSAPVSQNPKKENYETVPKASRGLLRERPCTRAR